MARLAREKFPEAKARIISDNGPQFIAKDFKEFIKVSEMTHVKTSRESKLAAAREARKVQRKAS